MRVSPKPPAKCSGCYQSKRDLVHIDFESAWNGPLINQASPRAGTIDWLVLCSECVTCAFELLPEQRDQLVAVKAEVEQLKRELDQERNYSARMEDTLRHRPRPTAKTAKRTAGRPKKTEQAAA